MTKLRIMIVDDNEDAAQVLAEALSVHRMRPRSEIPARIAELLEIVLVVGKGFREREEMREAQHIEIGLVDRIHPLFELARHQIAQLRDVPGQGHAERGEQIGERDPKRDRRGENA